MAARSETSARPAHVELFARLIAEPGGTGGAAKVTAIDPAVYLCHDRFARERETFFRRYPVIVAHESELAEPGAVMAHDHLGVPILLVRGRDGAVRAFLNACRHRNTKLVKPGPAKKRASIVCPYHSWTYDHAGALVSFPCPEQFPGVEKSERGLVPLPCAVRHGLVFVTPDPQGVMDLDAHLAGLGEDFEAFGVPAAHMFKKVEAPKRTNWKLIVDAFQDGYHIQYLHRHSIAPFFKDSCSLNERVGNHLRAVVARLPFDEARALPPAQWDMREHATFSHYVFPNAVFIFHPDYISILTLFPRSPGETTYVHTLLTPHAPRDEKERAHYERSFDLIENSVFQAEDLEVCERAQAAIEGGANWPMTLGAYEQGVAEFHAIVDEALARD